MHEQLSAADAASEQTPRLFGLPAGAAAALWFGAIAAAGALLMRDRETVFVGLVLPVLVAAGAGYYWGRPILLAQLGGVHAFRRGARVGVMWLVLYGLLAGLTVQLSESSERGLERLVDSLSELVRELLGLLIFFPVTLVLLGGLALAGGLAGWLLYRLARWRQTVDVD